MGYRGQYDPIFAKAESTYPNIPHGMLSSLVNTESRYNPGAVSPKGAIGLTQLMPGTASDMGVSNPYDPEQNVMGGAHYLSNQISKYGDPMSALRAYNGGGNFARIPSTASYAQNVMSGMPTQQPGSNPYTNPPQPQGPPPVPQKPMSLADLQAQQQPVDLGAQQQPPVDPNVMGTSPMVGQGDMNSLGAMAQGMPQMPQHKPSKFTAGNIMGVLGDALSAYGGKQPSFGPFLMQEQHEQEARNFEMQKFQQEIQMRMYAMRNGAMETPLGKTLMGAGIMPGDPRWTQAMQTQSQNELDPPVMTPWGAQLRSQITGGGTPAPAGVTFSPIGGN